MSIQLQSIANYCGFVEKDGKYFIEFDGDTLKEIPKESYEDYNFLDSEFDKYLKIKWPSFWRNPLKWLGIIKS